MRNWAVEGYGRKVRLLPKSSQTTPVRVWASGGGCPILLSQGGICLEHLNAKKDDRSRPTLRRSPNGTVDDENGDQKAPKDQDERPTLKRRDNDEP